MKRFWIVSLVITVGIVIALPVGAAVDCTNEKFANHPQCQDSPAPPSAVPIAVSIDADPVWVNEGDDLLRYTVTLANKTGAEISNVTVEFSAAGETDGTSGLTIPANDAVVLDGFSRYAQDFAVTADCPVGGDCELVASATVFVAGEVVTTATTSTALLPDPPCEFTYDGNYMSDAVLMEGFGVCIWTLPDYGGDTKTGVWEITLDPTPPTNPNRPIGVSATVRDGVPGNWCSLAVGDPSAVEGRWKVGDDPIVGTVYLPGAEDTAGLGLADGMCLNGGAGGEYFAVGNPKSFYLATTEATVTVRWVMENPGSP